MAISEKIIKHQKWWLLAIVLVIMLMSVTSTLWVRGFFGSAEDDGQSYQNITLTDAIVTCENDIRRRYGNQLRHLTLDNLSSRYDRAANLYRVFFAADMPMGKDARAPSKPVVVSCVAEAKQGKINGIELFEKKDDAAEPIKKRDGGIFGWP